MASILFGGGVVDARGSIVGNSFSRARSGATLKARIKGTNPVSINQTIARTILDQVVRAWQFTLSDSDRLAWSAFAASNPILNRFGTQYTQSGYNAFIQLTCTLMSVGGTITNLPPASTFVNSLVSLSVTLDLTGSPDLTIDAVPTGLTADEQVSYWASPLVSPGKGFISHQLRRIAGSVSIGPFSCLSDWTSIFGSPPLGAGQRIFVRCEVVNMVNGLRSAAMQTNTLAT